MTVTLQDIQTKAATDETFRAALVRDPKATLRGEGVDVPADAEVVIVEATANRIPLVIPPAVEGELSEEVLAGLSGGTSSPWNLTPALGSARC